VERTHALVDEFLRNAGVGAAKRARGQVRGQPRAVTGPAVGAENVLERVLVAVVPGMRNRFNFLSGFTSEESNADVRNMTVDLARFERGRLKELVELKQGNYTGLNPAGVMFELLAYAFLYAGASRMLGGQLPKMARRTLLTVLAPGKYFSGFLDGFEERREALCRFARATRDCLGARSLRPSGVKYHVRFAKIADTDVAAAQEMLDRIRRAHTGMETFE